MKDILKKIEEDIYPLTVVSDRYTGAYSGAKYLAFNLDHYDIPDEIGGGDPDEDIFWNYKGHEKYIIGKGDTPNKALRDLAVKLYPNNKL